MTLPQAILDFALRPQALSPEERADWIGDCIGLPGAQVHDALYGVLLPTRAAWSTARRCCSACGLHVAYVPHASNLAAGPGSDPRKDLASIADANDFV